MGNCFAYCLANTFDFDALKSLLENRYRAVTYKDAVHIEKTSGEAFLFNYGVIVSWGFLHDELQALIAESEPFQHGKLASPIVDEFSYSLGEDRFKIHADHITLASGDTLEKLAISHGLAQSVKLAEFEVQAQNTIDETAYIPQSIAETGHTRLSRKEIAKMRGNLYLVKSDIHLHFDLLDTPEFFWEYPELQDIYATIVNYLEVNQRVDILNKKLTVIHELFSMLADENNHKHSSTLEWIIIWLIAIEIIFFFIHDIFGMI